MRCTVPEISWHSRDPVYTVDIQPRICKNNFYRLATGGTDSHIGIWYVKFEKNGSDEAGVSVEFASDLQRHQKAVNVVRFSPNGEMLASGDDEAVIILWKLKNENEKTESPKREECTDKETWISVKTLRSHLEDIYDLSWSQDGSGIVSGSIDNTAIVWDVNKGRSTGIVGDHKGFVQGVAWDPKNKYLATLSADRSFRVFNVESKKLLTKVFRMKRNTVNNSEIKNDKEEKGCRLYHDDTLKTFFRRLCFTPDGELIITPCGVIEDVNRPGKLLDVTYIYTRASLNRPVVYLPSPREHTVCVRCCPVLFTLHNIDKLFSLDYRMVFGVATKSTVVLYDTQQLQPFAFVSNIHYTGLTDLTWSPDGRLLIVSSSEGYCSIISFEEGELGTVYEPEKVAQEKIDKLGQCEELATAAETVDKKETNGDLDEVETKMVNKPEGVEIVSPCQDEQDRSGKMMGILETTPVKIKESRDNVQILETTPVKIKESRDNVEILETTPVKIKESRDNVEILETTPVKIKESRDNVEILETTPVKIKESRDNVEILETTPVKIKESTHSVEILETTPIKMKALKDNVEILETTPVKIKETRDDLEVMEITPVKETRDDLEIMDITPAKDENIFKSPMKAAKNCYKTPEKSFRCKTPDDSDGWSISSDLSLVIDGDEDDLMSKVEQAKRLLSCSPSAKNVEMSPSSKNLTGCSPSANKRGRRVELITISSPRAKK